MRGRVLAMSLLCSSLAEALLSTPPKAVYAKWRLAARQTLDQPRGVGEGPPTNNPGPPNGGLGDGPGGESSEGGGDEEKKRGPFVEVKRPAQESSIPSGGIRIDVATILATIVGAAGTITAAFAAIWPLISHLDNRVNARIDSVETKLDTLATDFRVHVTVVNGALLVGAFYIFFKEVKDFIKEVKVTT